MQSLGVRDLPAEPKLMEEITDSVCQVIHKHGISGMKVAVKYIVKVLP